MTFGSSMQAMTFTSPCWPQCSQGFYIGYITVLGYGFLTSLAAFGWGDMAPKLAIGSGYSVEPGQVDSWFWSQ
jgi:hypothetical protein